MTASANRAASVAAAAALLVAVGCRKAAAPPAPAPADTPPPTAFFDWCQANHFGVQSPQSTQTSAGVTNLPGAPVGSVELDAWTKCETAEEARAYLAGVERDLRRAAREQGVTLDDAAAAAGPGGGFTIRYRAARNRGTLTGAMESRDNKEGGGTVRRYFLKLDLTETAAGDE